MTQSLKSAADTHANKVLDTFFPKPSYHVSISPEGLHSLSNSIFEAGASFERARILELLGSDECRKQFRINTWGAFVHIIEQKIKELDGDAG